MEQTETGAGRAGFRQMKAWRKVLLIVAVILTLAAVWFTTVVWSVATTTTPAASEGGETARLTGWIVSFVVIGFMALVQDGFLFLMAGAGLVLSAVNIWARVTWVRAVSIVMTVADGLCALSAVVNFVVSLL